jgi:hypothetical protein
MSHVKSTEELAAAKYDAAVSRHVGLLDAFERALRIVDDLYTRLEREMHAPYADKAWNPGHARDAVALSRALAQAGAVHARLLEQEAVRADNMSDSEKVAYMVAALKKRPASVVQDVIRELLEAVA